MKRRPLRKRVRSALGGAPAVVLFLFAMLVLLARQNNRCDTLRQENSQLRREVEFATEQLQRTRAAWHSATSRETIVTRAERELGLVEPQAPTKFVVFGTSQRDDAGSSLVASIRRGLDRYGRIEDAAAAEERRP